MFINYIAHKAGAKLQRISHPAKFFRNFLPKLFAYADKVGVHHLDFAIVGTTITDDGDL